MLKDIKNTLKQSAVYGLSRISLKFISFFLTPVYSIYFTVSEYGVLDRFERFWQIILAISLFGIETALLRWYTLAENEEKKKSLIFSILSFLFILNVLIITFGSIFSGQISYFIFDTPIYHRIIIYTFLIAAFEALLMIPLSVLRAQNKPVKYLLLTLSSAVISMGLQLYFLFYSQIKLEGIFLSKFIAPSAIFIILIPYLVKHIKMKIEKVELFDLIKFSFPLMLTSIVSVLLNSVNRFILGFVGSQDDVGLFSLASNISGVITALLISPFQLAFNVIFWQKLKDENAARFYTKSMTYSVFLYVWGALTLSLTIPYLIKLYIPKNMSYWSAIDLVPILSMSLVFYGMLTISYMSYHHAKRNDLIFYFQTGTLILNIALNYLLIPYFRMFGAAFSTFISFVILIIIMYRFSNRFYFIKYESYKIFMMIILACLIMCLFYYVKFNPKWLDIVFRIISILFYPFLLYFFRLYEEIEIISIKLIVRKYLKRNA